MHKDKVIVAESEKERRKNSFIENSITSYNKQQELASAG
jgi:hypothetical protein